LIFNLLGDFLTKTFNKAPQGLKEALDTIRNTEKIGYEI